MESLINAGFSKEEAAEIIEANAVAGRIGEYVYSPGIKINMHFYYGISTYISQNAWYSSVTGSHASVDYDFENIIALLIERMQQHGLVVPEPLLANIRRPYEFSGALNSRRYEDHRLQQAWEHVAGRYKV